MASPSSASAQEGDFDIQVKHLPEGTLITSATSVELTVKLGMDEFALETDGNISQPLTNKVILTYLPAELDEEDLKQLCVTKGPLLAFRLVRHPLTAERKGYAFAEFEQPKDAERACNELNGLYLYGKRIKVCLARKQDKEIRGSNLHVSGLSPTWTAVDLYNYFRYLGQIISCKILLDPATRASKGIAFVRLGTHTQAANARSQLDGTIPAGETGKITITFAHANGPNRVKRMLNVPSVSGNEPSASLPAPSSFNSVPAPPVSSSQPFGTYALFVGNIKPVHDETFLRQLFSLHGKVESVQIMKPGDVKGGGYGFVNMFNGNEAFVAVTELNNLEVAPGHYLIVSVKPKKQRNVVPTSSTGNS